jgi:methylenetetrahydrofolate dehydrogenase (NADP+)/methenyltetrahydrofolate cyclohydrolase
LRLCYPHECMAGVALDGKKVSQDIFAELKPRIKELTKRRGRPPALAVILVGDDPASKIYVRNKIKACEELGIRSVELRPPGNITTDDLFQAVEPIVKDKTIDAILVQMPLPRQLRAEEVIPYVVDPFRDVDGFGIHSLGSLMVNRFAPRACTPAGIMQLLQRSKIPIAGKHAVVVGRSDIVGKPMALMLLHENATVTVCHSKTQNLAEECRRADILVAAIGKTAMIARDYIKPGAVVIDVGMNRVFERSEVETLYGHDPARMAAFEKSGSVLVGDVEPKAMQELSSAYTPVPGGVGPLTIAMLMVNTVDLAEMH